MEWCVVSAAKKLGRLRRVTDLFTVGTAVEVGRDEEGPVYVWVNKLSAAERTECQRDGQFGAMRRRLALTDDHPEIQVVRGQIGDYSHEELLSYIVAPKAQEMYTKAMEDVRADPAWQDDLVLIDREGLVEQGTTVSQEEKTELAKLHARYFAAIDEAFNKRKREAMDDAEAPADELEEAFVEAYRENVSRDAFADEYMRTMVFFVLRDCHAVPSGDAVSHEKCTHSRLLADRGDVDALPEEVLFKVNAAYNELTMTESEAGNSDAPTTS